MPSIDLANVRILRHLHYALCSYPLLRHATLMITLCSLGPNCPTAASSRQTSRRARLQAKSSPSVWVAPRVQQASRPTRRRRNSPLLSGTSSWAAPAPLAPLVAPCLTGMFVFSRSVVGVLMRTQCGLGHRRRIDRIFPDLRLKPTVSDGQREQTVRSSLAALG